MLSKISLLGVANSQDCHGNSERMLEYLRRSAFATSNIRAETINELIHASCIVKTMEIKHTETGIERRSP